MSSSTIHPVTISRHNVSRALSRWSAAGALALAFGTSSIAYAGEILVGTEAFAVDGEGKVTDAARATAKAEIPSQPGDETWVVHLWAKLDKGAPGGLNIEFHGAMPDGKPYLTYSTAEEGYDGGKYLSLEVELEGGKGFNKNKAYTIHITQQGDKGKVFKLASGQVKLGWTEAPKDPTGGGGGEGDEDGEAVDSSAQDALDTLSGGGGGEGGAGGEGGPPPVEPTKKGCAIEPDAGGTLALLGLFALAASRPSRRRRN